MTEEQPTTPEPDEATELGDEDAGPEESPEVLNDPENVAAADALRQSTMSIVDEAD